MSDILASEAARLHLRGAEELTDEQLEPLIAAAEASVADFLGRPLIDPEAGWATVDVIPPNVVHAIKIVLTDIYEHRATPLEDMTAVRNLIGRYVIVSMG